MHCYTLQVLCSSPVSVRIGSMSSGIAPEQGIGSCTATHCKRCAAHQSPSLQVSRPICESARTPVSGLNNPCDSTSQPQAQLPSATSKPLTSILSSFKILTISPPSKLQQAYTRHPFCPPSRTRPLHLYHSFNKHTPDVPFSPPSRSRPFHLYHSFNKLHLTSTLSSLKDSTNLPLESLLSGCAQN